MVSGDDDDRVVVTILILKEINEAGDFVVDPRDGIEVSAADAFDIVG